MNCIIGLLLLLLCVFGEAIICQILLKIFGSRYCATSPQLMSLIKNDSKLNKQIQKQLRIPHNEWQDVKASDGSFYKMIPLSKH